MEYFVISDLHLGGARPPEEAKDDRSPATEPASRGFRMNTRTNELANFIEWVAERPSGSAELIINGDFVDFLAEEHAGKSHWRPFIDDATTAEEVAGRLLARERPVMEALQGLLRAGHALTLILGNHDVELSLPVVRAVLSRVLKASPGRDFRFLADGEAYRIGSVLIEHGNRYDGYNAIDHDGLRRLRSVQSRGIDDARARFLPPPGSRIVSEVMNEMKKDYPFVDLLKPETSACLPLLLALEPRHRAKIRQLSTLALAAHRRQAKGAHPRRTSEISSGSSAPRETVEAVFDTVQEASEAAHASAIAAVNEVARLLGLPEAAARRTAPIGVGSRASAILGFVELVLAPADGALVARVPALRRALSELPNDKSFDPKKETSIPHWKAAIELARHPVRHVVFGHTHLAKHVPVPGGGSYLNSGTWADLVELPSDLLTLPDADVARLLSDFVKKMKETGQHEWVDWRPHFVTWADDNPPTLVDARTVLSVNAHPRST